MDNAVPHELFTAGGVGTVWALMIHGTVDEPPAGIVTVGGLIVYVYTQGAELPVQSMYVHVYVLVPEHTGSLLTTGPVRARATPQLLFITGGVGTTCALMIQATVDDPPAGIVNVGGDTVYVCVHCNEVPVQSVYVHV